MQECAWQKSLFNVFLIKWVYPSALLVNLGKKNIKRKKAKSLYRHIMELSNKRVGANAVIINNKR